MKEKIVTILETKIKKVISACLVVIILACTAGFNSIAADKETETISLSSAKQTEDILQDISSDNEEPIAFVSDTGEITYYDYDTNAQDAKAEISELSSPAFFPGEEQDTIGVGIMPFSIIAGKREKISNASQIPYSAICRIEAVWTINGKEYTKYGSGFVMGPDLVVTSGHVICNDILNDGNRRWCNNVTITPGQTAKGSAPYGTYGKKEMRAGSGWVSDGNPDQDWAIINTDNPIGNRTGWLGKSCGAYVGESVNLTGYPSDKGKGQEMWHSWGEIKEVQSNRLTYDCDTMDGSSGSPVYNNSLMVTAINGWEYPNTTIPNYGPRMTEWLFYYLESAKVQYGLSGPGNLDVVDSTKIGGWALNTTSKYDALNVHIYISNNSTGALKALIGTTAGNYREDVGLHMFNYNMSWLR